jgi:hypothetical protein
VNSTEPKKIEDLPQFHVTGITQLGGRADGQTEFEFAGLTSDVSVPDLTGVGLAYLAAGWEAYHVWMVVEPRCAVPRNRCHNRESGT